MTILPTALSALAMSYCETEEDCRTRFRSAAEAHAAQLGSYSSSAEGHETDVAYLAPRGAHRNLLVMISGIHGIEGHVGSSLQRRFLERHHDAAAFPDLGVVLIHGANPWGFRHGRRVNSANVDLNRNFCLDDSEFSRKNPKYDQLAPLLNPSSRARTGWLWDSWFNLRVAFNVITEKFATLRQATTAGQRDHPKGIFFGGRAWEPEATNLISTVATFAQRYERILTLDLHTGYGARGRLHLFPPASTDEAQRTRIAHLFPGFAVDYPDGDKFYAAACSFSEAVARRVERDVVAMVLEYGTLDSQNLGGSLRSLRNMVRENALRHFGAASSADAHSIHADFREMFFPSSPEWRETVARQTDELFRTVLDRFAR